MSENIGSIMPIPNREAYKRGWQKMKQAVLALMGILLAAGILAGMVLYSVSVMRNYEMRVLTGDLTAIVTAANK